MKSDKTVFYAINDNPDYVFMVRKSVESLRRHNSKIRIRVYLYGALRTADRNWFKRNGVEVHIKPPVDKPKLTSLKWMAAFEMDADVAAFIDADTLFQKDIEQLFRAYSKCDFYARVELATDARLRGPSLVGTKIFRVALNRRTYSDLEKEIQAKRGPVFNTGIMIFNHGSIRKLAERQQDYLKLLDRLYSLYNGGKLVALGPHLFDELAGSLMLSSIPGISLGRMLAKHAPWYVEWKSGAVKTKGIVTHSFGAYFPFMVLDYQGRAGLRNAPYKMKYTNTYRPAE
jgi:hypothetical protein